MERNRSKKAKAFGASGKKIRQQLPEDLKETHSRPCPRQPPSLQLVRKDRVWRRFQQVSTVSNQAFTLASGHDQFLTITSTLGAAVPYVDCWRIRKIRCWLKSENGIPVRAVLSPVGTDLSNMNNDPEQIYSMESTNDGETSCLEIVVCKNRPLGGWHFTSVVGIASALFQVNITTPGTAPLFRNFMMDIEFDTRMNLAGLPLGYGTTTATTNLGTVGARPPFTGMTVVGINNLG